MKVYFVSLVLALSLFSSCGKDENTQTGGYTDVTIYSSDPTFFSLNAVGGWIYYPENLNSGLKGLIIYRKTPDEFTAYDRACSYDANESCSLLEVETNNSFVVDSCCGSRFNINIGNVETSPATLPMIQYRTSWDGSVLHIFN